MAGVKLEGWTLARVKLKGQWPNRQVDFWNGVSLTPAIVYPVSLLLPLFTHPANVHPPSFTPVIVKTGRVNYGRSETGRVWAVAGRQVGRALTGGWRPSSPPAAAAFQICCQLSIFELTRGQVSAVNIWRPIVDFWYLTNSVSCVEVFELHVLSWVGFSCRYGQYSRLINDHVDFHIQWRWQW